MKRYYLLPALLCLLTVLGCASTPAKPQLTASDEESFAKGMEQYGKGNYIDAIPLFEEVREKFPMSPYAVLAELRLGDCHYNNDEFIEAAHFFDNFRRLHPSNPQVAYSIYMRGMCAYQQMLSKDRDQTFSEEAVEHFQQMLEIFPQSPYTGHALVRIAEAKRQLAGRELFVGDFYMKKRDYAGAIERYNRALKRYPDQVEQDRLLMLIGQATIRSGDEKRGIKILEFMMKNYPESAYAPETQMMIDTPSTALAKQSRLYEWFE